MSSEVLDNFTYGATLGVAAKTGNFGDDDISGDVSWTGVDGLVTPVSSEYMDDFTYGATLGIEAASTGGFSLGLGVNYTGSCQAQSSMHFWLSYFLIYLA